MSNSSKKAFGFYVLLFAAILSLAAGLYFYSIHGTFGLDSTHKGVCYDPIVLEIWPCFCHCRGSSRCCNLLLCAQMLLVCGRCFRRH